MHKLLLLSFFITSTLYGIVAIKPREIAEKPGVSGSLTASFDTKRGNTETNNYKSALKVSYDNNSTYLIWGMLSYDYAESNKVKNTNNLFSHLRYIRKTRMKYVNLEAYLQVSEDEFKNIKERTLIGSGARWKVFGNDYYGRTYIGASAFGEHIVYDDSINPTENNVRGNFYLAYRLPLNEDSEFNALAYYQPRVDKPTDFYSSMAIGLQLHVYLQLYLKFHITHEYDSNPAVGVLKEDITSSTEFVLKF